MKILYAIASLVFVAASHAQQEPPSFKGVPFGTSAAEFFKIYKPGGAWGRDGRPAKLGLNESRMAVVASTPIVGMMVQGRPIGGPVSDLIAGVSGVPVFYFSIQTTGDFERMKREGVTREAAQAALFSEVNVRFDNRDVAFVIAALKAKYGEPTRTETAGVASLREVREMEVSVLVWESSELVVQFQEVAPPEGKALLVVKSTVVKSLAAERGASTL